MYLLIHKIPAIVPSPAKASATIGQRQREPSKRYANTATSAVDTKIDATSP